MAKIEWDDSFSVNNAELDSQHQKWVEMYNDMDESILTGKVLPKDGAEALKAMQDYARYHFSCEEEYLRKSNYPNFIEHRRLHKDFENLLYGYLRKTHDGEIVLNTEIISLLKDWLLDHILKEDKKYALEIKK